MAKVDDLAETVRALVAPGKGILAADESGGTIERRSRDRGRADRGEPARLPRAALHTAGAADYISGVILFDETIRQRPPTGRRSRRCSSGRESSPGSRSTGRQAARGRRRREGHGGSRRAARAPRRVPRARRPLREVARASSRSATDIPSDVCVDVNAHALARYAALCQEAGIVPIVEPEVLMDGDHTLARSTR